MTRQFCREKQSKNGHIFSKIHTVGAWVDGCSMSQHGSIPMKSSAFVVIACSQKFLLLQLNPLFIAVNKELIWSQIPAAWKRLIGQKGYRSIKILFTSSFSNLLGHLPKFKNPFITVKKFNKKGQKRLRNLGKQCHNRI